MAFYSDCRYSFHTEFVHGYLAMFLACFAMISLSLLGEPPSGDERRRDDRRSGARSKDERAVPWREGHGAKPLDEARERSPGEPKEDPQRDTARGESDEDQVAKAHGRRCKSKGRTDVWSYGG